jgi:hypothetical protein
MRRTESELHLSADEAAELARWMADQHSGHHSGAGPAPPPNLASAMMEALSRGATIHAESPLGYLGRETPSVVADGRHPLTGADTPLPSGVPAHPDVPVPLERTMTDRAWDEDERRRRLSGEADEPRKGKSNG